LSSEAAQDELGRLIDTFPRRPQSRWASWSEEETEEGNKMKNWDACVFGVGELSVDRV
jgi:hypothetical protein